VENFAFQGIVVELRRRSDTANEGTVVVEGLIDATSIRRVSMELRGNAHEVAVEAYRTGEEVTCVGALYVGVATHRLLAVRDFHFANRR
jgi:hypothetical protein